jgi:RNA polymerase sigma-70 factor (ECF subfamily)
MDELRRSPEERETTPSPHRREEDALARADPRETLPRATPPEDRLVDSLARVARGEEAALKVVYDALAPRVLGIAQQILRDRAVAEEAVVDVFAQVWRQAGRYDAGKGSPSTWICTLARTRAIDLRRQRQRHLSREADLADSEVAAFVDPTESPLRRAVVSDRADVIQSALDDLPGEQRRVVVAAFFGGLSHTEIAAAFGQPLGTVKTRIRSGLAALRSALLTFEGEAT